MGDGPQVENTGSVNREPVNNLSFEYIEKNGELILVQQPRWKRFWPSSPRLAAAAGMVTTAALLTAYILAPSVFGKPPTEAGPQNLPSTKGITTQSTAPTIEMTPTKELVVKAPATPTEKPATATSKKEQIIDSEITPENFLNNFEFVTKEQLLKLSAERPDERIFPFMFKNYKNVTIRGNLVTAPDGFFFLATESGKLADEEGYYNFLEEYRSKGGSKEKPMTLVAFFPAGKNDAETIISIEKTNIGLGKVSDQLQIAAGSEYTLYPKIGDQVQKLDKLLFAKPVQNKKYPPDTALFFHSITPPESDEADISGNFGGLLFPSKSDFNLNKYLKVKEEPTGKIAILAE